MADMSNSANKMMEDLKKKLGDFKNPKFKIKGTEFSVTKLPPIDGMDLFEFIRHELAITANSIDSGTKTEEDAQVLFFKTMLAISPAAVKQIRRELFVHIQFKGNGVDKGWAPLPGMEEMAFHGFEVSDIYEVLARALYINFSGSFSGIGSMFKQGIQDSAR